MISSSGNVQVKTIKKLLKSSKTREEKKVFVVEGTKMFEEARIRNLIRKAYISESYYNQAVDQQPDYFDTLHFEVVVDKVFGELSDTITPQGILALAETSLTKEEVLLKADHANLLFLENIQDPGNLGTILRTAEGAGFTGVVLSKGSVDIYNPKVVRATMGSIFRLPFTYADEFLDVLKKAKENNITLYAAHLKGKNDYDKERYGKKCGIIIGNEANGITETVRDFSDVLVRIPMCGQVESLNAAVAASVFMYEVFRQKRQVTVHSPTKKRPD